MTTLGFNMNSRLCGIAMPAGPFAVRRCARHTHPGGASRGAERLMKHTRTVVRHNNGLAFQPRALLALVSYCYARQVYQFVWRLKPSFRTTLTFVGCATTKFRTRAPFALPA